MKTSEKARQRNRAVKSRVRGAVKEFEAALGGDGRDQAFVNLISELDRAVTKGVLPKKRVSRKKSRLAKRLNDVRGSSS